MSCKTGGKREFRLQPAAVVQRSGASPSSAGRLCLVAHLPLTASQQEYLGAIKGVGIYRANAGPHDEPRWEYYGAAKPSS